MDPDPDPEGQKTRGSGGSGFVSGSGTLGKTIDNKEGNREGGERKPMKGWTLQHSYQETSDNCPRDEPADLIYYIFL